MEAKTTEGAVNCHALPKIKPFRPFARLREKYQQLERVVQSARKRGEQLRESLTPISARAATRASSAAPAKATPKPSSNKRVNTLRRMTAEAARQRKADPARTRNAEQPRHSDKPAASRKTESAPHTHKRVAHTGRSASSVSKTDSAKNGKA